MLEDFDRIRPRLLAVAYRMLGSIHDAEDIVQTAYLRARRAEAAAVENPEGWLTTVTARLCLDHLRSRRRRAELPLLGEDITDDRLAPEEQALHRERVSRALLAVLTQLTPAQRVAFVLHDVFAVPFDQIAAVLETSTASAKKLASRARHRITPGPDDRALDASADRAQHARVVAAFLDAARGGDLDHLTRLLAPEAVRIAEPALLSEGAVTTVRGGRAVAEETRAFLDRIRLSVPVLIDGEPGAVIAPAGRPAILIRLTITGGLVSGIDLRPYRRERLGLAEGLDAHW